MIAPCGIECDKCSVYLASDNPEMAERLADSFKKNVDPNAEPSWFHCQGCPGDRKDHWNPNCWILVCCVDNKKLQHCNQCPEFACEGLVEWAGLREQHKNGLEYLKRMGNIEETSLSNIGISVQP